MRMSNFARSAALSLVVGLAVAPAVHAQQDNGAQAAPIAQDQQQVQTAQAKSLLVPAGSRLADLPRAGFGPYDRSDRYIDPQTGNFAPGAPGLNGD